MKRRGIEGEENPQCHGTGSLARSMMACWQKCARNSEDVAIIFAARSGFNLSPCPDRGERVMAKIGLLIDCKVDITGLLNVLTKDISNYVPCGEISKSLNQNQVFSAI